MTNKDNVGPASGRELLEMAAKAAGIKLHRWMGDLQNRYLLDPDYDSGLAVTWNPLTADGDALRLAVTLGINIGPELPDVIGKSLARASWLNRSHSLGEYGGGDKFAATRRAIVRAAAAIGSAM